MYKVVWIGLRVSIEKSKNNYLRFTILFKHLIDLYVSKHIVIICMVTIYVYYSYETELWYYNLYENMMKVTQIFLIFWYVNLFLRRSLLSQDRKLLAIYIVVIAIYTYWQLIMMFLLILQ